MSPEKSSLSLIQSAGEKKNRKKEKKRKKKPADHSLVLVEIYGAGGTHPSLASDLPTCDRFFCQSFV